MGDRFDRFRSLVRRAAVGAAGFLGQVRPLSAVRETLRELRDRRVRIPDRVLARAVLRAGTVSAASVRARRGRIEITAELASGRAISAALIPAGTRFAPRGAKELFFDVDPPEASEEPVVRAIAGLLGSAIARALWAPLRGAGAVAVDEGALVDRETGGRLRIDLRTCPMVRDALSSGAPATVLIDALTIEALDADEQGLSFRVGLPTLPLRG
jgi:hypothetical protein